MKKKFLSFVLAICLIIPCMMGLAACSEGPDAVVGTYKITSLSEGEATITREDYLEAKNKSAAGMTLTTEEHGAMGFFSYMGNVSLELKENKEALMTFPGEEPTQTDTQSGTWAREGNVVTLTANANEQDGEPQTLTLTFDAEAKTLTDSRDGGTMVYTNVENIVEPTPVKVEEVVGKYEGTSCTIEKSTYTATCSEENFNALFAKLQSLAEGEGQDPLEEKMYLLAVKCYPAEVELKVEEDVKKAVLTLTNPSSTGSESDVITINGSWTLVGNIVTINYTNAEEMSGMVPETMFFKFDARTNTATYTEITGEGEAKETSTIVYSKVVA